MPIRNRNIHPDAPARTMYFPWTYDITTATAALLDTDIYVPVPYNGRVVEIGVSVGAAAGAANSGSASLRFYRNTTGNVASATTTGLLHSGTISIGSGTTVGAIQTATLNTGTIAGKDAGMVVSAGTVLLVNFDTTATNTVNVIYGYFKIVLDDLT